MQQFGIKCRAFQNELVVLKFFTVQPQQNFMMEFHLLKTKKKKIFLETMCNRIQQVHTTQV